MTCIASICEAATGHNDKAFKEQVNIIIDECGYIKMLLNRLDNALETS